MRLPWRRPSRETEGYSPEALRIVARDWIEAVNPTSVTCEGGHDRPVVITVTGSERLAPYGKRWR